MASVATTRLTKKIAATLPSCAARAGAALTTTNVATISSAATPCLPRNWEVASCPDAAKRAYRRLALQPPLTLSLDDPEVVKVLLASEEAASSASSSIGSWANPRRVEPLAGAEVRVIRVE
mmetsp:Transcript_63738/g.184871  ORF Transcript_63738/g.184871 Transcript_63738/m.184871 type:complete len:121 (-) Transcript_63738:180-542(-)